MERVTGRSQVREIDDIRVRFWAAARSAAGVAEVSQPVDGPVSLAELIALLVAAHPGGRLAQVLPVCSILLGDQPLGRRDPAEVTVEPGTSVEFLPPYAGG